MDTAALVFQSTHPSGVRPPSAHQSHCSTCYFNPRTPVGCDTPGQTPQQQANNFNPRTPVGCDCSDLVTMGRKPYFNPRTPVGCDIKVEARLQRIRPISIHAPQWGATPTSQPFVWWSLYFNPRTPVGCDPIRQRRMRDSKNFNPRTPVGCDVAAPLVTPNT